MKRIILFLAMVVLVSSCAKQPAPDGRKDNNRESDGLDFTEELSLSFMADTVVLPDFVGEEVERIECECDWVETWFEADEGLYMSVKENPEEAFYPYEDEERHNNYFYGNESSSRDAVLSVTLSDGEAYSVKIHQKPHPAAKMSVVIVPADEDMQPVGGIRNGMWSFCLDEIELGENTEDVNFFIMPDTYLHLYYGYRYEGREKIEEIFYDIIRSGGDENVHVFNLEEYVGIRESHDGFIFNTDNMTYLVYVPIDDEGNRDTSINILTVSSPL